MGDRGATWLLLKPTAAAAAATFPLNPAAAEFLALEADDAAGEAAVRRWAAAAAAAAAATAPTTHDAVVVEVVVAVVPFEPHEVAEKSINRIGRAVLDPRLKHEEAGLFAVARDEGLPEVIEGVVEPEAPRAACRPPAALGLGVVHKDGDDGDAQLGRRDEGRVVVEAEVLAEPEDDHVDGGGGGSGGGGGGVLLVLRGESCVAPSYTCPRAGELLSRRARRRQL
jgi:hypothetical protein